MEFTATVIPGVIAIDPVVFEDPRGFVMETWRRSRFREAGIDAEFVQNLHSRSSLGTVRGLHYQIENAQGKLLRAIRGEVFDVAVDIRKSSPTFGQWIGETLSEGNRRMLWIPPGFAHGFAVLSDFADLEYRLTDYYAPQHERTILWNDPDIGIEWPVTRDPVLSEKDAAGVRLAVADVYA